MKIHDKFVIELSEVIKGYGNDYRDEDPCHMPCDYKFYEINGVSICEESFKKMKRLEDEINDVLDKIKRDIFNACSDNYHMPVYKLDCDKIFEIIDKYKAERGDKK